MSPITAASAFLSALPAARAGNFRSAAFLLIRILKSRRFRNQLACRVRTTDNVWDRPCKTLIFTKIQMPGNDTRESLRTTEAFTFPERCAAPLLRVDAMPTMPVSS
jgi:hypothetical protein